VCVRVCRGEQTNPFLFTYYIYARPTYARDRHTYTRRFLFLAGGADSSLGRRARPASH